MHSCACAKAQSLASDPMASAELCSSEFRLTACKETTRSPAGCLEAGLSCARGILGHQATSPRLVLRWLPMLSPEGGYTTCISTARQVAGSVHELAPASVQVSEQAYTTAACRCSSSSRQQPRQQPHW